MKTYKEWAPTGCDTRGLGLDERQDWLVAPVIITRDSGIREQSNWEVVKTDLEELPSIGSAEDNTESDVEVHRFGHWGPGWFEIMLVRPDSPAAKSAEEWEGCLSEYPIACESHYSELEMEECERVWRDCYDDEERIEMIRNHRSSFEFHDFKEMLACARGKLYTGYSELILDE